MSNLNRQLNRILIKGGILAPSELKQLISFVEECGLSFIQFGSRQDILFSKTNRQSFDASSTELNVEELSKKKYQNIVSSYVSADIFPSTSWITGTTYLYILEQFRRDPCLKVNIVDPQQRLVPLFTGDVNVIASTHDDYWFVYLKLPGYYRPDYYPVLIHTWDISQIAYAIEDNYKDFTTIGELFEFISKACDYKSRTIDKGLTIPFYPFPYYEGMNKMNIDQYWLGLYWRNNQYDLSFLKELCNLCLECRIGNICITPWKSFIIKGIGRANKLLWEKFLGRNGINVRHSSLELNWHLPVNDLRALELKRFIVHEFDQRDVSTYGLTFGIYTGSGTYFTSVVIKRNAIPDVIGEYKMRPSYDVLFSKDFNPNTQAYNTYALEVDKMELPTLLIELSQSYFNDLGQGVEYSDTNSSIKTLNTSDISNGLVYQCPNCMTVYDQQIGDAFNNIEAGRSFKMLPEDYQCSLCDNPKANFVKLKSTQYESKDH